ncbi:MAG: phosphate signaling complex protein PhoU [Candidatus Nanopelagicales bacterium]|nr:phosphate signaling complex protein PhoU [Candidatus Nanopelagicales bacterium]
MRSTYDEQLQALESSLVDMTHLVERAIVHATKSILEADLLLAEAVIAGDEAIDSLAAEIEDKALQMIALQAPVATDLRIIVSGLRISASLERMGDLAVHVAKAARLRYPLPAVPAELHEVVTEMGNVAHSIVRKTGEVLAQRDVAGAAQLAVMDDRMDQLHRELFVWVLSPDWVYGIEAAIDVTLVSRYYERFADHAVTIGKRVVHIVTGAPYKPLD